MTITLNFGNIMVIVLAITVGTFVGKIICDFIGGILDNFYKRLIRKSYVLADKIAKVINYADDETKVKTHNKQKHIGFVCESEENK